VVSNGSRQTINNVMRNDRSLIFIGVEFQRCKVFRHWFLTFPLVSSPEILDQGSVEPVISAITAAALAEAVVLDEASALD
jgi:hypothetical protein